MRNTYKRTHRWQKILRDQDELELVGQEWSLVQVLFSTLPDDVELYGKPMARNAQIWTEEPRLVLDWAQPGRLHLVSTHEADLTLNLPALTGASSGSITLAPAQAYTYNGHILRLHLQAGIWYSVVFPTGATDPPPPLGLPTAAQSQGWYILTTGHNILQPFLKLWLNLGGVPVVGSPLDDAQRAGATGDESDLCRR